MQLKKEKELIKKGFDCVCGVDEVGRGPLAGPIVICCYILDIKKLSISTQSSMVDIINDSKKLSDKKRRELVGFIKNIASDFSFGESSNVEVDTFGIVKANEMAIKRGVDVLKNKPDYFLFDYNVCDLSFLNTPSEKIIKGDASVFSIACSSILAKVYRDDLMIGLSQKYSEYGFEKHVGYGTKKHIEAIKKNGLSDIHRESFCKRFVN